MRRTDDRNATPQHPLPIDCFLRELANRTRRPKLDFTPPVRDRVPRSGNLHLDVYLSLERAFSAANKISGGNLAGYRDLICGLEQKLTDLQNAISDLQPDRFASRWNMHIGDNPFTDQRKERYPALSKLEQDLLAIETSAELVLGILSDDRKRLSDRSNGRPSDLQKKAFVGEAGKIWTKLTGEKPSPKTGSVFGKFLIAAWRSGFKEGQTNPSFERAQKQLFR